MSADDNFEMSPPPFRVTDTDVLTAYCFLNDLEQQGGKEAVHSYMTFLNSCLQSGRTPSPRDIAVGQSTESELFNDACIEAKQRTKMNRRTFVRGLTGILLGGGACLALFPLLAKALASTLSPPKDDHDKASNDAVALNLFAGPIIMGGTYMALITLFLMRENLLKLPQEIASDPEAQKLAQHIKRIEHEQKAGHNLS